jgi:TolB-like protein/Flp pilus assembly protein TadD
MSEKPSFFAELKRRNVYKVAAAYAVGAWLLIQAASIFLPAFDAPPWVLKACLILVLLGFPIALVLAWAFEITPEGIKRESDVEPGRSVTARTGRRLIGLTIALAVAAAGLFAFQYLRRTPASAPQPNEQSAAAAIPAKSIAVLPFENLSSDKENAYFADGVQDEILTDLAKIADLKVISRTSVMQYKDTAKRNLPEIAQALKVAHVLEGSVQRAEHRVRVTAQLIDARTDAHLWAQRYDGDLSDVFAIQAEIAQKIADQLQAVLSPKEKTDIAAKPTSDLAAYDLYLRATELRRKVEFESEPVQREVVRLLEEATTRDPNFVPALCALANAHSALYWFNYDHTEARLADAKRAIAAAERLKPDAGEVHLAKGLLYYWGSRNYESALAELQRARASLPNDSLVLHFIGSVERRQGRLDEATRHMEEAVRLDPQNTLLINTLAENYDAARRYQDVVRLLDEALRWKPDEFSLASFRADLARESRADLRPLEALLGSETAKKADPDTVAQMRTNLALLKRDYAKAEQAWGDYKAPYFDGTSGFNIPREMNEGIIARGMGDSKKAEAAFLAARERAAANAGTRPDDAKALAVVAYLDAVLGRNEEAVREGERAVELLPVTKDALSGPSILMWLAGIYSETGQFGRALDILERTAPMDWGPSYGDLKLDLRWDPLRGNPRFEKIVASLAPKSVK